MTLFPEMRPTIGAALALALGLAAWSPASDAATVRVHFVVPTAICDAALAVFDDSLRKRPRAIANEGTQAIFTTCAIPVDGAADKVDVNASFLSKGSAATVQCTMVSGTRNAPVYTVRSTDVYAGGRDMISWPALTGHVYALSCHLPAGIEFEELMLREISAADRL